MRVKAVFRKVRRAVAGLWFKGLARLGQSKSVGSCRIVWLASSGSPDFQRIEAAIAAVYEYDAVQSDVVGESFNTILVPPGAETRVLPESKMAIIGSEIVEGFVVEALAGQLVFLANYATLLSSDGGAYVSASEMECTARKSEMSFLEKVPDTIDMRLRLHDEAMKHGCQ